MSTKRVGTVTIEGLDDVMAAFETFGAYGIRNAKKAVRAVGEKVRIDAIESINAHQSAGNEYIKPTGAAYWIPAAWAGEDTGGKTHKASTKGNPPNTREGALVRSIKLIMLQGGLNVAVGSSLDYAYWLEFGTTRMGERPWLYPAMRRNTQFFINALQAGLLDAAVEAGFQRGRIK